MADTPGEANAALTSFSWSEAASLAHKAKWAVKQEKIKQAAVKATAHKLTPITADAWAALDGKAKWDSIVALRGPDLVHSDVLKWFTSSIIRHMLHNVMRVGGLVNNLLPFVVLPASHSGWDGNFDITHFCGHIYEAAGWLHIPTVYIGGAAYHDLMVGHRHPYEAEVALLSHLTGDVKDILKAIIATRGCIIPDETEAPSCQE